MTAQSLKPWLLVSVLLNVFLIGGEVFLYLSFEFPPVPFQSLLSGVLQDHSF